MKTDKKKSDGTVKKDISEISIERIRKANAEFINLSRIFTDRSRKLKEILDKSGAMMEREL